MLASLSRVALAWHFARCGAPFQVIVSMGDFKLLKKDAKTGQISQYADPCRTG